MENYTIKREWYNEIKNLVSMEMPEFFTENNTEYVEVYILDVDKFKSVSRDLGWMY